MCKSCLTEVCPDRGNTTLDGGNYLLNFKGCASCGKRLIISDTEPIHSVSDEDGQDEEIVRFSHKCSECDHEIGKHQYSFAIENERQEFSMNCLLCGHGAYSCSIQPRDPRKLPPGAEGREEEKEPVRIVNLTSEAVDAMIARNRQSDEGCQSDTEWED